MSYINDYYEKHGWPTADSNGHRTRMSDSSLYDEVCVLCGSTDRSSALQQSCHAANPDLITWKQKNEIRASSQGSAGEEK